MLFRDLKRLVNSLLDSHRWNHDDELRKAVALVQLEDGAQINVGLAGAGFHLHSEIARGQRGGRPQAITNLDVPEIGEKFIIEKLRRLPMPRSFWAKGMFCCAA